MQEIIVEKPYKFVPPHRGSWFPYFVKKLKLIDLYLSFYEGVTSHEVRHVERLNESLREGHGIILAPNHCRYADPLAMGWIATEADIYLYAMASWHLFNQSRLQALAMRMVGAFSIYREGVDRASLETALEILTRAERPLVIFPEGTVFRTNDRVQPLLDGVSFLARSAARRRNKAGGGKVVIHPIAVKYLFHGNLETSVSPILDSMEKRLTWDEPDCGLDLLTRVERVSEALFSLKEIQYLGAPQKGCMEVRKNALIRRLLEPLEKSILGDIQEDRLVPRIKQLRSRIVPQLTDPKTPAHEKKRLRGQLADIYVAQQIEAYPVGYLEQPTDTRLLETIERLDEDLHDQARIHRPLHCVLEIGSPILAEPGKPPKGEPDPIMDQLEGRLGEMLERLSTEAKPL